MDDVLYTFLPTRSSDQIAVWGSLFVVVITLTWLIYLLKKKSKGEAYQRQMLLAMLVFFALMIAAVTAFFSFWTMQKTGPVYVYENSITTPYGNVDFIKIRKVTIDLAGRQSLITPGTSSTSVRMLFLEEKDGKIHVLSEDNYDIDLILKRLKELTKNKKEKK